MKRNALIQEVSGRNRTRSIKALKRFEEIAGFRARDVAEEIRWLIAGLRARRMADDSRITPSPAML